LERVAVEMERSREGQWMKKAVIGGCGEEVAGEEGS
jgi:hypothetical protein